MDTKRAKRSVKVWATNFYKVDSCFCEALYEDKKNTNALDISTLKSYVQYSIHFQKNYLQD